MKQQKPTRNTKNFKKLKVQNKKKEIRKEKKNSKGMQIRSKRQVVKVDWKIRNELMRGNWLISVVDSG